MDGENHETLLTGLTGTKKELNKKESYTILT